MRRIASLVVAAGALALLPAAHGSDTPTPTRVVVAGSLQAELGCPGDWEPGCESTALAVEDGVWQGTFDVPAGSWEYKAALDGSWDENYGANATRNGANVALSQAAAGPVKFFYSHDTHWITSNRNATIATAPGSYQSELGCAGDWDPSCLRSWLQDPDGDGTYAFTTYAIPPGSYEVKVAIDESWSENYGEGGVRNGPNIPFTVAPGPNPVTFTYDSSTHVLTVSQGAPAQPGSVGIPGSFGSELGCAADWDPACAATQLTFDAEDRVWQGSFEVPAGSWEYKAALDGGWDENYGANATRNGPNVALSLASGARVKFFYDHATHWITSDRNATIATAPGSYQSELGCAGDWDPSCLRSWLQDPDGDGTYAFTTQSIPPGAYEVKVAIDESWSENYGEGGVRNGPNIPFTVAPGPNPVTFTYDSSTHVLTVAQSGARSFDLRRQRAHWLTRDTLAWTPAATGAEHWLHYAEDGGLTVEDDGVTGERIRLHPAPLPDALRAKWPHLAALQGFRIDAADLARVDDALRGQLAVSVENAAGEPVDATGVQIPGVVDDLYATDAALGVTFAGGVPTLRVWAPTAHSVKLLRFETSTDSTAAESAMTRNDRGVWSVAGDASWTGDYYAYEIEVYAPSTMRVETNVVTDPYSVSLSRNSRRSQIVDLASGGLMPPGWGVLRKPALAAPEDVAVFELHVRDFSATDATVPPALRGTFKAFAIESTGTRYLRRLAAAGMTHVHLLPAFDIATVDEDKSEWQSPGDLSPFPPDSEEQQARVSAVADTDGFNWGYDPWHYNAPEGSYATDADGPARVREFRELVQALNRDGLRVVMDVVYNHTSASGQSDKSVLDRIVPGYYHRLNANGAIERSTCCENTATEHRMMEKLMVDSVVLWAKQYKVDGFRFDIMGHHSKANMLAVRSALDELTPTRDGVDGRSVYVYGEAWNFGEVVDDTRFVQARQANMAGTGIGSFNDRIRDAVRGGGPFDNLERQGFASGLYYDSNGKGHDGSLEQERQELLRRTDWLRVSLAGNLADYTFVDRTGATVSGRDVMYHDQRAGYTADPQEVVNYVEAHDNETLYDAFAAKLPLATSMEQRVRAQVVALSTVLLAQGVPFLHAGGELLRSKSMDRNSYNSGDWFNRLDFSMSTNNWGVGLPPARDNQAAWSTIRPLLANPALRPTASDIAFAHARFLELLGIRTSSPLFRLRTGAEVQARLGFRNTGPGQVPGVVVMELSDAPSPDLDADAEAILVVFNATDEQQLLSYPELRGRQFKLHRLQRTSTDEVVTESQFVPGQGRVRVPARTTAVFVEG